MAGEVSSEELRLELRNWVRKEIGPDCVTRSDSVGPPGCPKPGQARSCDASCVKIAENDYGALGDTSTLADPSVVNELIDNRANR